MASTRIDGGAGTDLPGQPRFADVHPNHVRSQHVLTKLGFQPSHSEVILGMLMLIYLRQP